MQGYPPSLLSSLTHGSSITDINPQLLHTERHTQVGITTVTHTEKHTQVGITTVLHTERHTQVGITL